MNWPAPGFEDRFEILLIALCFGFATYCKMRNDAGTTAVLVFSAVLGIGMLWLRHL